MEGCLADRGCPGEEWTCILLVDVGELLVQELLQVTAFGNGDQALHQFEIHGCWVVLNFLHNRGKLQGVIFHCHFKPGIPQTSLTMWSTGTCRRTRCEDHHRL